MRGAPRAAREAARAGDGKRSGRRRRRRARLRTHKGKQDLRPATHTPCTGYELLARALPSAAERNQAESDEKARHTSRRIACLERTAGIVGHDELGGFDEMRVEWKEAGQRGDCAMQEDGVGKPEDDQRVGRDGRIISGCTFSSRFREAGRAAARTPALLFQKPRRVHASTSASLPPAHPMPFVSIRSVLATGSSGGAVRADTS
ncbi:hypothetical protein CERSUDRAFT_93177 [Gelatoporia subvermispora B]|uniref:Uncharacterized protein n=1 Tax=Ceriporiopsis subvermispora (strain B) TaxID=914234 RepID=M2R3N1_CERS8|nr:hypothetical protein CERSUDRAFT_93177 [Gelatoporia subvermispora B]